MTTLNKKLFVFSNLATSIDGKIATQSREFFPLGSSQDRKLMVSLRNRCDALLMGASTLRTFKKPCVPQSKERIFNIIVSTCLDGLDTSWDFFKSDKIERILIHTEKISEKQRSQLSKFADLIFIPEKKGKDLGETILRELEKRGLRRILIEGGGDLMWVFSKEALIDRYYLTLVPRAVGGRETPTLIDGIGHAPNRVLNLKLVSVKKVKSELYLEYKTLRRRGKSHPEFI